MPLSKYSYPASMNRSPTTEPVSYERWGLVLFQRIWVACRWARVEET
jgi:hypothetical protein